MSKRVVAIVLTILLLVAPIEEPLFCKETKAAEIGMVGALPGSVTLWEIFQTIFAAAGIIVANDNIQSVASTNLGSSAYTLEEMERLGFIRIPTDGSSALDWDWSGLEDQLQSDASSEDTKIIQGVFGQNGGQGSGGNDSDPDEDPWYKKAVNWVKNAVVEGKIKLTNEISNGAESVTYSLTALAGMIGAAFNGNVKYGLQADSSVNSNIDLSTVGYYTLTGRVGGSTIFQFVNSSSNNIIIQKVRRIRTTGSSPYEVYDLNVFNASDENITVTYFRITDGTKKQTGTRQLSPGTWYSNYENNNATFWPFPMGVYGVIGSCRDFGISAPMFETDISNCADQREYIESLYEQGYIFPKNDSPDIITPTGNAVVPSTGPAWVPTPYLAPGTELEIIPQPKIDEFTQYIIEEVPDREAAGEAWVDTVEPFTGIEPTPVPTQRPQPTQKPEVTRIPDGDPGGEDNPINVTNPDPMPVIEGGFATTYGLMDFFPFCIPSDIVTIYKLFETEEDARAAPYIDWNIKIDRFGIDEHIVLDFSIFDSSAEVCRILMFITFCFGLLLATKQLIWS